jgi:acetyl esterase/lipase
MKSVARAVVVGLISVCVVLGCARRKAGGTAPTTVADPSAVMSAGSERAARVPGLLERRKGFVTKLVSQERDGTPPEVPPPSLLRLVRYRSPAGELATYLSPPPKNPGRLPAMLWIVGGFDNGIGNSAWRPADPANDQSARAFREAGLVLMQPSFRGGNDNPGFRENFYGEVDDVLAAAEYLSKLECVDPKRIYLGGHSTGGTMALLVAAATDRFRAVFAFGPVASVLNYGEKSLAFDVGNPKEAELRSPIAMLDAIATPTFVIEGTNTPSNMDVLTGFESARGGAPVHLLPVAGADHFSILAPATRLLAAKIRDDRGSGISLTVAELAAAVARKTAN